MFISGSQRQLQAISDSICQVFIWGHLKPQVLTGSMQEEDCMELDWFLSIGSHLRNSLAEGQLKV